MVTPSVSSVAVVTGAAGGLGPACCRALMAAGAQVVAVDLDGAAADALAEQLRDEGGRAGAIALDVSDREVVQAQLGGLARVDVLVNLAGVIRRAPLSRITEADLRLTLATHLEGTLNTILAVAPTMREVGYGRIVNTSSIAARGTIAGGSYSAAKGAVEGLTRSIAIELAPRGITVNCVAPGLIDAGIFLSTPEEYRDEFAARVPAGRLGDPADVASAVAYLASPAAGYVTGQTLTVCGGLSLGF